MRGIILSGGKGTRLEPVTRGVSKQLLPIYDKPMIFYPLSTLMLAKIKEILVIVDARDLSQYQRLLDDGSSLGLKITYQIQDRPRGLADAFIVGEEFVNNEPCSLILGDNLFHGQGLGFQLSNLGPINGAMIFGYQVSNPQEYGIVEIDDKGSILSIEEKPRVPRSNYAIPGLYFFDSQATEFAKRTKPSARGELEITSILQQYLSLDRLTVRILQRGTAWLDAGTIDSLFAASSYIKVVEERQGMKIACVEEIAWRNGWISDSDLLALASKYNSVEYKSYLESLLIS